MSVNAFELIKVIENVELGEKHQSKIECIECCGNLVYVGTSNSYIIQYLLEPISQENGCASYSSKRERLKHVDSKNAITCIKGASALNRILLLCNWKIFLLEMMDLSIVGGTINGITMFCLNENPGNDLDPFCAQICCASMGKNQLQVYNVTEEQIIHVKEIHLVEPAIDVALDGENICVALLSQYSIYNFQAETTQKLFTFGTNDLKPIIQRITKDEFLVSAPADLGMFVTAAGMSSRPPMQWSDALNGLAYAHPYILAISNSCIIIHSILDQQQKQVLPFAGGRTIGNYDGQILISNDNSVYGLRPLPWQTQVEALLSDDKVEDALLLATNVIATGRGRDSFQQNYRKIQQKAAFIYFARLDFDGAHQLFVNGLVDVCEVISIFPNLLPASSSFIRSIPPLHSFADVYQLFNGNEETVTEALAFLINLLEAIRLMPGNNRGMEIDSALVKLYAKMKPDNLEAFIGKSNASYDIKDCCGWLEKNQFYHALALVLRSASDDEKAFKIWAKILEGEYFDDTFPGLGYFVECLANIDDEDLIWRYADFVLRQDEELGADIFILQSDKPNAIKPDSVVEFLHRYPKAVVQYLEHLVLKLQTPSEKFHTHLAVLYLENILKMKTESNNAELINADRCRLRTLLQQSSLCRVQLLLGRMNDAGLFQESTILYGKLEQHEKALDILVYQLKDFQAAEEYCVNIKRNNKISQNVFHLLLSTYLKPNLELSTKDQFIIPALQLLNARASEFDATQVLEIVPTDWPITVVESFLRSALRKSLHEYRMSKMAASLARGENLQKKCALYDLEKKSVPLVMTNYCCICKKPFLGANFARYPNDVLAHPSCVSHKNICPITGRNFLKR